MEVWDKKWSVEQIEMLGGLITLIENQQYKESLLYAKEMINKFRLRSSYIDSIKLSDYLFEINTIMESSPICLKDLTKEKLHEIKLFYVITRLLGYGNRVNIPYIPKDYETGINYTVRVCMRLLNSYLWEKIKIRRIEKDEIVLLTVLSGCKDNPCDYYKTMYLTKTFEVKDAPELPCYDCKKETGCYCEIKVNHLGYKR